MKAGTRRAILVAFVVLASIAALSAVAILVFAFTFSEQGLILVSIEPIKLERVDLRDVRNRTLWSIQAQTPTDVYSLRYGEIPEGFRERVAPARRIREGEPLLLIISSGTRWTRMHGVGRRKDGFRSGDYIGGDLSSTPLSVVFDEASTTIDDRVIQGRP